MMQPRKAGIGGHQTTGFKDKEIEIGTSHKGQIKITLQPE